MHLYFRYTFSKLINCLQYNVQTKNDGNTKEIT